MVTYAQWRLYKLIETAARDDAASKEIILDEGYFRPFLDKYYKHVNCRDWQERRVEVLEPFWPGITAAFPYEYDIISVLVNILRRRDTLNRAFIAQQKSPKMPEFSESDSE